MADTENLLRKLFFGLLFAFCTLFSASMNFVQSLLSVRSDRDDLVLRRPEEMTPVHEREVRRRYYAVAVGRMPGIYMTWEDCHAQTAGYINARHRAFDTQHDAQQWLYRFIMYGGVRELDAPNVVGLTTAHWVVRVGDGSDWGPNWGKARALRQLAKPVLIVISSDGFRWGYNHKVPTPNINRLRLNGTEAETGMIPVYPSLTFSSHYSIATGLYPAWHGIIENHFSDPYDPGAEPFSDELPERLLYSSSDRVQPIIGNPAEGFKVVYARTNSSECGGAHGYDNSLLSMRTVFIAHGPQFARGRKVPLFVNVELYNVFTTILGLELDASNNGSSTFASSLLLDSA